MLSAIDKILEELQQIIDKPYSSDNDHSGSDSNSGEGNNLIIKSMVMDKLHLPK